MPVFLVTLVVVDRGAPLNPYAASAVLEAKTREESETRMKELHPHVFGPTSVDHGWRNPRVTADEMTKDQLSLLMEKARTKEESHDTHAQVGLLDTRVVKHSTKSDINGTQ